MPDSRALHVWQSSYKAIDKKIDSLNGGNWYSTNINPKEFEIKCYFEAITKYQLETALALFKSGANGE